MFTPEEIEALALGSQWVLASADERLARTARNALAKIGAVLPPELSDVLDSSTLLVVRGQGAAAKEPALPILREAIRIERKVAIDYVDAAGGNSRRVIWPFALAFFDQSRVVVAWCETRVAFRHFRTDRILAVETLANRYPRRRQSLLRDWRAAERIKTADEN
jgi:predicted DNA-binding transcriptional regulator YafY